LAPARPARERPLTHEPISVRALRDGGQPAEEIAHMVADFLAAAEKTLDLAQYDFHLAPETAAIVGGAIKDAAKRGVAVRMIYDVGHRNPIPVPPPPEPDVELISSLGVPHRPIAGIPDLMHHKYAVRDGTTVWTGSTNWTDDSWSRQENVIVMVESSKLASAFTANFEELWTKDDVELSGFVDPNPVRVGDVRVRAWFTPGFGEALSRRIAKRIRRAERRVRICSPVMTVAPVLSALCERVSGDLDIAGCLDRPQIEGVIYQWGQDGNAAWKLPLLERALAAPFSAKPSTPYGAGSVHDFMHAKLAVVDDVVFTGSYNLSRSGEQNAENVLEIEDADLAERLAGYVDEVRARYPRYTPTSEGSDPLTNESSETGARAP
jgi:phosphatidylserine/phosphatidylglycerophosphate/cardiolipin synthase-like enzyme